MALENANPAPEDGPGPPFIATYSGWCSAIGDPIEDGDEIQADGEGGWQHTECAIPTRREQPPMTSTETMGY